MRRAPATTNVLTDCSVVAVSVRAVRRPQQHLNLHEERVKPVLPVPATINVQKGWVASRMHVLHQAAEVSGVAGDSIYSYLSKHSPRGVDCSCSDTTLGF